MDKFMRLIGIVTAGALVLIAGTVHAQTDLRTGDAMQLFTAFCLRTDGDRSHALATLGEGNLFAKKLPDTLVKTLQAGRDGGVAWAMASPNAAQLLLEYTSDGICGVRIADADEKSVQEAFATLVQQSASGEKMDSSEPEVTKENGVQRTYRTYTFPFNGRKSLFAISTLDHRVGPQQHFLTFGHLAP